MTEKNLIENIKLILITILFMIVGAVSTLLINKIFSISNISSHYYFIDKNRIHLKIVVATKNGASLDDIKQLYLSSDKEKNYTILNFLGGGQTKNYNSTSNESIKNSNKYYNNNTIFLEVLKNIKSELYLQEKVDVDLIKSMAEKIKEHEQSNPFDRLELGQRVHFEIIKTQLGDKYTLIQNNINRIVDEIDNKNKLVNKYFSDATMSYNISIFALFIGLLALFPMIIKLWKWIKKKSMLMKNET